MSAGAPPTNDRSVSVRVDRPTDHHNQLLTWPIPLGVYKMKPHIIDAQTTHTCVAFEGRQCASSSQPSALCWLVFPNRRSTPKSTVQVLLTCRERRCVLTCLSPPTGAERRNGQVERKFVHVLGGHWSARGNCLTLLYNAFLYT